MRLRDVGNGEPVHAVRARQAPRRGDAPVLVRPEAARASGEQRKPDVDCVRPLPRQRPAGVVMARPSLLTVGNPKTLKGEAAGYLTAVLHLAPADTSGVGNVCPMATAGCKASCLNTAGRGGIFKAGETSNAQSNARIARTRRYFADRAAFTVDLHDDIAAHARRAKRTGLTPCVRVNGTSDLPGLAAMMADSFPDVQFYDYTKVPQPWKRHGGAHGNYHLTFSRSESNDLACRAALAYGVNVAVVFSTPRGRRLPETWHTYRVVDGDTSDLRFLDPRGVVVGLRAKGRARRDTTGFVVPA